MPPAICPAFLLVSLALGNKGKMFISEPAWLPQVCIPFKFFLALVSLLFMPHQFLCSTSAVHFSKFYLRPSHIPITLQLTADVSPLLRHLSSKTCRKSLRRVSLLCPPFLPTSYFCGLSLIIILQPKESQCSLRVEKKKKVHSAQVDPNFSILHVKI